LRAIEHHAAVGDSRSIALIADDGAIDWLSWPRCDSDAVFGALLDDDAGSFRVAPVVDFTTDRRYLEGTNILVTTMRSQRGAIELTDFMPMTSSGLAPEREIIRSIRCLDGEVDVSIDISPRPGFARGAVRTVVVPHIGVRFECRGALFLLRSDVPLGITRMQQGQRIDLSFSHAESGPAVIPALGARVDRALDETSKWWRSWSAQTTYRGPYRDVVDRSALALKLLCYGPSGAVLAAATTSLPERVGASLNWDYRYCWLRDASLTVRALLGLGHEHEAAAFCGWLLHATRNTWPRLRVLYDVYGVRPPRERVLSHIRGYEGSKPVRVGNLADTQLQLDLYGEVIDAVAQLARRSGHLDGETEDVLVGLGGEVLRTWHGTDHGIWEPRGAMVHHTHSRLLCWVAVDRLLDLHRRGIVRRLDVAAYERAREEIRHDIESRAWNPKLESYTGTLDGDDLDASVLLLSFYGFEPASSPRMRATGDALRRALGTPRGLFRNRQQAEGTFLICGFWEVEHVARGGGTRKEAERLFQHLLATANDVGLFAEEVDPESGELLGNFPQAFSHVGAINAALTLAEVA
jgi:GH15 family glucan-1,4-alpha-glucosidase